MIVGAMLLVAGPTLLPRFGRYLGKTITGLRDSAESFSANMREEMKAEQDDREQLLASNGEPVSTEAVATESENVTPA